MRINHRFLFIVLALWQLCCPYRSLSQSHSDTLQEVKIQGKHNISDDARLNDFSPGQKVTTIDTTTLQQYSLQSMANLLAQQVPVFVKSYGLNGLATLNFRGSSAAQSAVLWNGVPIQNAALGIADVSTIPVLMMSNVNIVYGSSSALWGSGNVGGALLLGSGSPVFDSGKKSFSVSGGAGSFSQYMGGLSWSISGKKLFFSVKAFGQTARNDFPYTTPAGTHRDMPDGQLQSGSLMLHGAIKNSPTQLINIYLWLQQYDRQIPPALYEPSSRKMQTDASVRLLTDWQEWYGRNKLYGKLSYIRDNVKYRDEDISLANENIVYQIYAEFGWRRSFGNYGQVLLFTPIQFSGLRPGTAAGDTQQQKRVGLAGAYELEFFKHKLSVSLNARGEIIDSNTIFLPGVNASFRVNDWLLLRANVQRTYRTPTLNELYYFPGGNNKLKPEQGWNEDCGYAVKVNRGRFSITHDLSVFNRNIHDWIYWVGGAIWTPHNIAEVRSRGVETENNISYKLDKWKFHIGLNTSYVLATTVSSYIYNDGSIGRQIPYTPRYNGQVNAGFAYKSFSFNYNHTYTGYRFTTTDESAYMSPYQTGNLQLMYNTGLRHYAIQFIASCNNLWDQQYQVVDQRPMPGINWLLGFNVRKGY